MHITGVVGKVRPTETLDAALRLLPGTKHVVVVGGMGKFDEQFETVTKQAFEGYESEARSHLPNRLDYARPCLIDSDNCRAIRSSSTLRSRKMQRESTLLIRRKRYP